MTLSRIRSMFVRDVRIQLSYPFQILSQLAGIALSLFSLFFLGRLVGSSALLADYDGGYFEFALIGVLVLILAGAALQGFNSGFRAESGRGTFEILLASPVQLGVLVVGWLAWPLALAAVEGTLTFGIGWFLAAGSFRLGGLISAALPFMLTVLSFIAIGLMAGAFSVITKRGDPITPIIMGASTLLAGAVFPIEVLPEWMQAVARLFPAFYGFNAMRGVLIGGQGLIDILNEVVILVGFNLVLIPLGLWMLRRALRVARVTGTLATG